jgi:tRNA dimethylallyltransferase
MKECTLTFIVGPTASGKTQLAIEQARERNAIILSCDSLCFYRGMDIGTAKPTREEQALVPHFGIDLVEPDEAYSVGRYIEYRNGILSKAFENGQDVVVVGGSGFYLKSFLFPVTDNMSIPAEVTKRAEIIRRDAGLPGLLKELRDLNPSDALFEGLDLNNPRRVEKALIRCLASGKTYRELRREFESMPEPLEEWRKEVWLIDRTQKELQARNRQRINLMLEAGLVDEVVRLRDRGFERNPSACGAIGYREVLQYLDGHLTREDLEEAIYIHTNQLMRKQRTWFKHQIPIDRIIAGR